MFYHVKYVIVFSIDIICYNNFFYRINYKNKKKLIYRTKIYGITYINQMKTTWVCKRL